MSELLDAIAARIDAATEGPWKRGWYVGVVQPKSRLMTAHEGYNHCLAEYLTEGDAEFIANARTDIERLLAAVRAVERLHQRFTIPVITGECAKEECDHEDDCPTIPYDTCQECYRLLEDVYPYFAESGVEAVAYPCPTVLSLTEALEGEG